MRARAGIVVLVFVALVAASCASPSDRGDATTDVAVTSETTPKGVEEFFEAIAKEGASPPWLKKNQKQADTGGKLDPASYDGLWTTIVVSEHSDYVGLIVAGGKVPTSAPDLRWQWNDDTTGAICKSPILTLDPYHYSGGPYWAIQTPISACTWDGGSPVTPDTLLGSGTRLTATLDSPRSGTVVATDTALFTDAGSQMPDWTQQVSPRIATSGLETEDAWISMVVTHDKKNIGFVVGGRGAEVPRVDWEWINAELDLCNAPSVSMKKSVYKGQTYWTVLSPISDCVTRSGRSILTPEMILEDKTTLIAFLYEPRIGVWTTTVGIMCFQSC